MKAISQIAFELIHFASGKNGHKPIFEKIVNKSVIIGKTIKIMSTLANKMLVISYFQTTKIFGYYIWLIFNCFPKFT